MESDPGTPTCRELVLTGLIAAAVTLVAAFVFYGFDVATGARTFFTHEIGGSDIWHLHYPMKHFYQKELHAGRLALWSPEIGTGYPLHAEGQVGALYPINLALFYLLPLAVAFNWGILLHVPLAGAFAAMFARQLTAGRAPSAVAAVVFAFSGFFVTHLKHINMTASAVWAPLLLLLIERYAANRRCWALVGISAAVAASILGGHPQIVYNNLLVAGVWGTVALVRVWRRRPVDGGGRGGGIRFGAGLAGAVVIGLLLGLPQILPTRELSELGSPRKGGVTIEYVTQWEYQWKHLLAFVAPKTFGDPGELVERTFTDPRSGQPLEDGRGKLFVQLQGFEQDPNRKMLFWEMTGYVGLLPLALAAAAIWLGRRRGVVRGLVVFLACTLLMTLGKNGGLFYLGWYLVPAFKLFRFHDRFLLYVGLAVATLAALALTWLPAMLPEARRKSAGLIGVAGVGVVAFLDLFIALSDHNPKIDVARWEAPPPSVERIRKEEAGRGEPFRVAANDPSRSVFLNAYARARGWKGDLAPYDVAKTMIDPNLNILYGLSSLHIYYQLYPQWLSDLGQLFYTGALDRVADVYNVRYLLTPDGPTYQTIPCSRRPSPALIAIRQHERLASYPGDAVLRNVKLYTGESAMIEDPPYTIDLYRNADALPRAFLVPAALPVQAGSGPSGLDRAVHEMARPDFDPRREVLLSAEGGQPENLGQAGDPIDAPVTFVAYTPQEVRLDVEAPKACWLFFSDTWYPGWRATVDGQETPIHRANLCGRAVWVPAGRAEVVFTYAPRSFRLGLIFGLIGLVLLVALPWLGRFLAPPLHHRR